MEIKRDLTAKFLGTGKRAITGIALHDTCGSATHNDTKYLANPGDGRKVSVDFTVERDGSIYQLNPDLNNKFCFHAGRATKWKGKSNAANNAALLGIEIVQKADLSLSPLYPDAQVQAVAELCFKLCTDFNLKKEDITTHAKIITDGSRSDPRKFPFDAFWKYFSAAGTGTPADNSLIGEVYHKVVKGDTLSGLATKYNTRIETIKGLNGINDASNQINISQSLRVK